MGLRRALRLTQTVAAPVVDASPRLALGTPWQDGNPLTVIETAALWGLNPLPVTRADAMAVPGIARARHLLVSTIARMRLIVYRDGEPLDPQPVWSTRADAAQSAVMRMAGTVDDLIFHGESLWLAERDSEGNLIRAEHVPYSLWETDPDGRLLVQGDTVAASRAIHIPGLHEGILTFGAPTITGANHTLDAAVDTARHPFRLELHDEGDYPLTRDERRELVADARTALADNLGVLYTSPGIDARVHAVSADELLVAGRESFAVDGARLVGVPAPLVDAHSAGATMTYQNADTVLAAFLHLGLDLYMTPVSARLSLDDVCPRGQEVRYDVESLLGVHALTETTTPATTPAATTPAAQESTA